MAWKGLVGGIVVGLFSISKDFALQLGKAPAIEAFLVSAVYAGIFLLIFVCRGVLATKQPAMTASRIAKEIDSIEADCATENDKHYLEELVELLKVTFRTQSVAVLGNVLLAAPVAAGIYWLLNKNGLGTSETTAHYFITSLHPTNTLTIYYAALTGVCLSLSGIFAGASKNWFIFHDLDDRLRNRLKNSISPSLAGKITDWLAKNLASITANVSLGVMLGCMAVLGYIFGLPLDVRHITFASAQVGSALAHFNFQYDSHVLLMAGIGVALIGFVNLIVSFGFTFLVVLKSRRVTFAQHKRLFWMLFKSFLRNPLSFFLPLSTTKKIKDSLG
jgi:site-specific recombinase